VAEFVKPRRRAVLPQALLEVEEVAEAVVVAPQHLWLRILVYHCFLLE
jgi:hypothetical protein